jgi:hypothetical protein
MVNPTPQIPPSFAHPTIPPPAPGIGTLPFGFGAPPDMEPPSGQEQGGVRGRDRVRNAWGNLRERLGLRPTNTPANPSNEPNLLTRTRPDGTPMDAREVMLAEMARAFNLGLGLGADATGQTNPSPPENESGDGAGGEPDVPPQANARSGRPLPPEDSFERFLINLQSELRVALSQPHLSPTQPPPSEPEPTSAPTSVPTTPITMSAVPPVTEIIGSELPSLGDVSDSDGEDGSDDGDEGARSSMTTDSDMPPLLSNNPSHATFPSINPPTFAPTTADASEEPTHPAAPGSASRTEHRPGGSINWWRLYRFPPIFAPQAQGNSAALNNTSSATSTAPGPDMPDGVASTSSEEPSSPVTPHPLPPGAPNVVIPVIVVGLQSVNMNRRREQRTGENGDAFGVGDTNVVDNSLPDDAEFEGFPNLPDTNAEPQQGRSWHSRAANAIRNLRPGRRGAARETQPGEGPGSRTFLIYVIGGGFQGYACDLFWRSVFSILSRILPTRS